MLKKTKWDGIWYAIMYKLIVPKNDKIFDKYFISAIISDIKNNDKYENIDKNKNIKNELPKVLGYKSI